MNRVHRPTSFKTKTAARSVGENLRTWRKMHDLTIEQMAFKANVSRDTISRLEHGDPSVSLETFLNVCNMVGITNSVVLATDPYETDFGRLRAEIELPQRVRNGL